MPEPYFDPSHPPTRGGGSGWDFILWIVGGVIVWIVIGQLTQSDKEKALKKEIRDAKKREEQSIEDLHRKIAQSRKTKPIREVDSRTQKVKPIREVNSANKKVRQKKKVPKIIEDHKSADGLRSCKGCNRKFLDVKFSTIPYGHMMFNGGPDDRAEGSVQADRGGTSHFCWECENSMSPENAPKGEDHGIADCPNCGIRIVVRLNCFNKQAITSQKLFMQCGQCADLRVQELGLESSKSYYQIVSWDSEEDQDDPERKGAIYYPWSGSRFVGLIYPKGIYGRSKPAPKSGYMFDWRGEKFEKRDRDTVSHLGEPREGVYRPRGPTIFNAANHLTRET